MDTTIKDLPFTKGHFAIQQHDPGGVVKIRKIEYKPLPATKFREDVNVIGTMFYIMAFVPGRIFWDCTMPDLSAAERAAVPGYRSV